MASAHRSHSYCAFCCVQADADNAGALDRPILTRTVDGYAGAQAQPELSLVQAATGSPSLRLKFGQQHRDLEIDRYRSSVRPDVLC